MSNPVLDNLADKANRLPLLPGVYIMLDEHNEVIYVGHGGQGARLQCHCRGQRV